MNADFDPTFELIRRLSRSCKEWDNSTRGTRKHDRHCQWENFL